MTIKKLTVIAAAGAVLLAGAIGISMKLTSPHEVAMEVTEKPAADAENGMQTLSDMENIPLYYSETEKLLLPLRNVMEGLGGTVVWNNESKMTEVSYRGRMLALRAGEKDALLNGYQVTLPVAAEVINGCLYADEVLLATYFTGDVEFNIDTKQVVLQTKDSTEPVLAMKEISGKKEDKAYIIEVPVIVGLNDSKYEESLNDLNMQKIQNYVDAFLSEESTEEGDGLLQLKLYSGLCDKDFVSMHWEGTKDGVFVKLAENIDLLSQKTVTLADMLSKEAFAEVQAAAGEGWTEDRFYLTDESGLVLLKGTNDSSLEMHHWTTEGKALEWKKEYKILFEK